MYCEEIESSIKDRNNLEVSKLFEQRKIEISDESNSRVVEIMLTGLNKIKYKLEGENAYWVTDLE